MKASLIQLVRHEETGFGQIPSCNLSIYHILSAPLIRPVTHLIVATLLLPLCWNLAENEAVTAGVLLYSLRLLIKLSPVWLCEVWGIVVCQAVLWCFLTWVDGHCMTPKSWQALTQHLIKIRDRAATSKAFLLSSLEHPRYHHDMSHESGLALLSTTSQTIIKLLNWSIGSIQFSLLQCIRLGILLVDPSH